MTHALAIARREVEERTFVFVAAIAMAIVPFVAFLAPHTSLEDRTGVVVTIGFFIAVAFTWALGLILGTTLVGRELVEKRLSFYFSRPVSGAAIWFGKLIGATVLLVLCFAITSAVPLGLGGSIWRTMSVVSRSFTAAAILAAGFTLMLLAHVGSTWIRSRSAILGLDFAAIVIFLIALFASIMPLAFVNGAGAAKTLLALTAFSLVVAIPAAGAWQLERGRVDARRSHRELSRFLWTVMAIVLAAVAGFALWAMAASPRDLRGAPFAYQSGNVVSVDGAARNTNPVFLVDLSTGAFTRGGGPLHAGDGDVAAYVAPSRTFSNAFALLSRSVRPMRDMTITAVRFGETPIALANLALTGDVEGLGVSAEGSRLGYVVDDVLVIYETRSHKSIAAKLPVDGGVRNVQMQFLGNVVRVFSPSLTSGGWMLNVDDLDLVSRKWRRVMAPVALSAPYRYVKAGTHVLSSSNGVAISDLGAGETRQLANVRNGSVWVMRDGRVAFCPWLRKDAVLQVMRGGAIEREIHFPAGTEGVRVAAEIGAGRLLAVTTAGRTHGFERATYVVDANTGNIGAPMTGVMPALTPGAMGATEGQPSLHALVHLGGGMSTIDTTTGAIRKLY